MDRKAIEICKQFISNNKIEKVFELLEQNNDLVESKKTELILLKRRFSETNTNYRLGVIGKEKHNVEITKISFHLLKIIDNNEKLIITHKKSISLKWIKYLIVFLFLSTSAIFIFFKLSLNKDIQISSQLISDASSNYMLRNKKDENIYCIEDMFLQLSVSNNSNKSIYIEKGIMKSNFIHYSSSLDKENWDSEYLYEGGANVNYYRFTISLPSIDSIKDISILNTKYLIDIKKYPGFDKEKMIFEVPANKTEFLVFNISQPTKFDSLKKNIVGIQFQFDLTVSSSFGYFQNITHTSNVGLINIKEKKYLDDGYFSLKEILNKNTDSNSFIDSIDRESNWYEFYIK